MSRPLLLLLSLLLLLPVSANRTARAEDAPAALAPEPERETADDHMPERADARARFDGARRRAPCVASEDELLALGEDIVRYGKLTRDDFRAERNLTTADDFAVEIPDGQVGAHVALLIACVRGPLRLEQRPDGRWEAWIERVRYYALLDRSQSWWNPRGRQDPDWVLGHEQLHFDLAELIARRHNARNEAGRAIAAVAATDQEALAASDRYWTERLEALWAEFRALERQYDRETRHGTVEREQARWSERTRRELAATRHLANR